MTASVAVTPCIYQQYNVESNECIVTDTHIYNYLIVSDILCC